jgi:hypothetical protein
LSNPWEAGTDFDADGSMGLALAPALYVPSAIQRPRSKKYDAAECERTGAANVELARELGEFAVRATRHLRGEAAS